MICESEIFDEMTFLKQFVDDTKIRNWNACQTAADKRWVEIFCHFKKSDVPHKNIQKLVEYALCLPGTNAVTERIFALVNKLWTSKNTIVRRYCKSHTFSEVQHFRQL